MAKVTSITMQSKNVERANLYLDGEFACGISRVVLGLHNIKVGTEITLDELNDLKFESEKDKALTYALNYISRYTTTEQGLKNKLYEKEYCKKIVDYVVEKTKEYGYINDLEYARCYVEYNKEMKGAHRIRQDLLAKGIKSEYIDKALEGFENNSIIFDLALKHCKNQDLDDPKYIAKLTRFLQYRGFEYNDIKHTIDKLKEIR